MIGRREFLGLLAAPLAPAVEPGPAMFYVGAFPGVMLAYDEATEKVIDKTPVHSGVPRGFRLSYDKKKIYINTTQGSIEIYDIATRKITSHFTLDEGNRRVRTRSGLAPDPQDKLLYTIFTVATKEIDRFKIDKAKFGVIDIASGKMLRTVDLPKEEEARLGWGGDLRVSPDGKQLYIFTNNVLIFDTTDFKLLDKIDLAKPPEPWMATLNLGFRDDPAEDRGVLVGMFNSTDPIVRRSIFGIARFDLNKRTFDFSPIGPASAAGVGNLQITPDRKTGYTVTFTGDVGNRRCEFWVFDMPTRKVNRRVEFDGPVNFGFTLSGDGKSIYLHGTAPVIEIYDAATLKPRKSIDFGLDLTTRPLVMPRGIA